MRDVTNWEAVTEKPGKRKGWWIRGPDSHRRALLKIPRIFHIGDKSFECAEVAAEVLASQVGESIGIPVPQVEPVWYRGTVCSLAWDFVEPPYQLREGVDLLGTESEEHRVTFDEAREALAKYVGPEEAARCLTYMGCFDILIGNSDRHQGNWGVLAPQADAPSSRPSMAPFYDNGSAFGSNLDSMKVHQYLQEGFERFDRRFRYEMAVFGARRARLAEVWGQLARWKTPAVEFAGKLSALTDERIQAMIQSLPCEVLHETARREFAIRLLAHRRALIERKVAGIAQGG